jgi:hypothetical protein
MINGMACSLSECAHWNYGSRTKIYGDLSVGHGRDERTWTGKRGGSGLKLPLSRVAVQQAPNDSLRRQR